MPYPGEEPNHHQRADTRADTNPVKGGALQDPDPYVEGNPPDEEEVKLETVSAKRG